MIVCVGGRGMLQESENSTSDNQMRANHGERIVHTCSAANGMQCSCRSNRISSSSTDRLAPLIGYPGHRQHQKVKQTSRTTMTNLPMAVGSMCHHLVILAAVMIALHQISSPNYKNQVHCSPQVFSSLSSVSKSLNIVNNQLAGGQQQPSSSSSLAAAAAAAAAALRRETRATAAAASIEASEPAELMADDLAASIATGQQQPNNRDELEEMAGNGKRLAPEMVEPSVTSMSGNLAGGGSKLRIVRLLAPEATQNGTQNVTLDCMFKFDKNLDQRLTIKWFFNEELEPIYQWIPELNKRVYSDKYERYLDKSYEVSDDLDYMLQSYRWLIGTTGTNDGAAGIGSSLSIDAALATQPAPPNSPPTSAELEPIGAGAGAGAGAVEGGGQDSQKEGELEQGQQQQRRHRQQQQQQQQFDVSRRLLAGRLSKLAKLGGRHSRQLIDSLRSALYMEELEFSRFRALRLIQPTSELNGRFTCSVSSLDGDDLRSTKLVVYEPAKSFSFNVSRLPGSQQYNLSCQAGQVFPRPALALYRYRAGPLEAQPLAQQPPNVPAAGQSSPTNSEAHSLRLRRPKLAATLLRQEPLAGVQTQISTQGRAGSQQQQQTHTKSASNFKLADPRDFGLIGENHDSMNYDDTNNELQPAQLAQLQPNVYEISSWALVEESSLSSNVLTQFECQLTIDGTGYDQRQSLALQRGWHVNSAAFTSRHTLVGLFSALASLLCLMLALVSSMLIFRLLKRHARNRVHQLDKSSDGSNACGGLGSATNPTSGSAATVAANTSTDRPTTTQPADMLPPDDACGHSDGVYRVPEPKSYGTRFIIGPGSGGHYYGGGPNVMGPSTSFSEQHYQQRLQQQQQQQQHQPSSAIMTLESHIKPLYC